MLAKNLDVQRRGTRFGYINTLATTANINARNIHFTATQRNVSNMHNVDSLIASACVIPASTACWASTASSGCIASTLASGTPPVLCRPKTISDTARNECAAAIAETNAATMANTVPLAGIDPFR